MVKQYWLMILFSQEKLYNKYVGTQGKCDDQQKRGNNSNKYGSFVTDITQHQSESQDECILCGH